MFEALAAVEPYGFTYSGGSEPETLPGNRVSRGFFDVLAVPPLCGRTFTPDEYTAGRNHCCEDSCLAWRRTVC